MSDPIITVYSPESSLASPAKMLHEMVRDLYASRELSWRLAVRDLKAQYRQAFLGFMWALILPLANTAIWVFLSMSGIVTVSDTKLPYAAYVFFGTILWSIFIDAVNAPLQGTLASQSMLSKISFPREAIVVSGIYQTLFNSAIKAGIMLAAVPFFGIGAGWNLFLLPLGILSLVLVGTAIGVLITPVGLLYTDVGKGMPLVMQFLMYLTPVVFAMPKDGVAATLFAMNPLTPVVVTAREFLAGGTPQFLGYFLAVNAAAFVLLMAVWVIYRLAMPILIERMSA